MGGFPDKPAKRPVRRRWRVPRPAGRHGQHEVATAIPCEHIHPDWSSDGHSLAFAGLAGDRHQIIRFDPLNDPAGTHAQQLTACAGSCLDDMDPALSSTDTKIAYLRIGGPLVTIGQVEMPGTQNRPRTPGAREPSD